MGEYVRKYGGSVAFYTGVKHAYKLMQRVRPPSKSSENMERGASFDFVTFKGRLILISILLGRAFLSRRLFKWDLFSFSLPIKYKLKLKLRKGFSESKSNLRIKIS